MNAILIPAIQNERCTRYRFRYSECARCAEACPHDAMRLTEEGVDIEASACRHCGLCLSACPTDVFQSGNFSRPALVRAAGEAKVYTVACAPSGATGDMTIPCLGALDAATAAFILARGTELRLAGLGHCVQCAHGAKAPDVVSALMSGVEHVRAVHKDKAWGRLVTAEAEGEGVDRIGAGRRQFFRRLVAGGAARLTAGEVSVTAIPAKAVRAAAHYKPLNRELLDRLLGDRTLEAHPAIPAGRVRARGACNACDLCDRVCPTGALQSLEQEGWWQLQFRAQQCVGCGVCIEACQPGAIAMADTIAAGSREGERIFAVRRQRCEQCGRLYVPEYSDAACPVCADDDRSFAAIFG